MLKLLIPVLVTNVHKTRVWNPCYSTFLTPKINTSVYTIWKLMLERKTLETSNC